MPNAKVNIISGWSGPGGSTIHHISLTNLLNENGHDCTFYGPHTWHLDKCRAGTMSDLEIGANAIVISHFLPFKEKINCHKHILSCHETNLFPLHKIDLKIYDLLHYVSARQKNWHSVHYPCVIIPPIIREIVWESPENNFAGVVGTINSHKQTHKSIERALQDGFDKVLLFGLIEKHSYYEEKIKCFIEKDQAIIMGHEDDCEKMYNTVEKVYHSSILESYGLVEAECRLAGIPFDGPSNSQEILSENNILKRWEKIFV